MKWLFIPLFVLSFCHETPAQSCYRVVAKSGLNIRETPSVSGKKVVTVPFLACIDVLENREYDMNDPGIKESIVEIGGLKGRWLRVKYDEKEGYAFDAFFGMIQVDEKPKNGWGFWQDEAFCSTVFYPRSTFKNQYALIKHEGEGWELQPVELDYFFLLPDECVPVSQFNSKAINGIDAHMVIGTDRELKTGVLPTYGMKTDPILFMADATPIERIEVKEQGIVFKATFQGKEMTTLGLSINQGPTQMIPMCDTEQKYCIQEWAESASENEYAQSNVSVMWLGDLDADGKADMIMDVTFGDVMYSELWLSSLAKKGDYMGWAGRFNFWYCC